MYDFLSYNVTDYSARAYIQSKALQTDFPIVLIHFTSKECT